MARTNAARAVQPVFTREGAPAVHLDPYRELRRSVLACMLFEDTFYESGNNTANRIAELVGKVSPEKVVKLAIEAREEMKLRHAPLFLVRQLAHIKGAGSLVATTLPQVIQRADELAEFVSIYWKDGRRPLSAGVKRGLAAAFRKFNEYALAKWNRDNAVRLRDVLFLCHAKPADDAQADLWKRLVENRLDTPVTWETELSAGKDKRATFEMLLREGKLGGMAVLMNLRNMQESGVDELLIRERLEKGIERALPFRFITAARYAPRLESSLELGMFKSLEGLPVLPGKTGILIDVSGSMEGALSKKGETTRMDAACGLAVLAREKCEQAFVATFSEGVVEVPARRGFALRDAITRSQGHGGTFLGRASDTLRRHFAWAGIDRLIVITDEQSSDPVGEGWAPRSYMVNVATFAHGVGYGNRWTQINGWSERIIDYIRESEQDDAKEVA